MLIKEMKETTRQTIFVMSFWILIPVLYLLDSSVVRSGWTFIEYISNGTDLFVLVTSAYLAYNMFKSEREQDAVEYLLSLPISRNMLLLHKVLPRLLVCLVLLVPARILNNLCMSSGSVLESLFLNWNFGFLYIFLLLAFIQLFGLVLNLIGIQSWSARLILSLMIVLAWQGVSFSCVIDLIYWKAALWNSSVLSNWFLWSLNGNVRAVIDYSVFFALIWYLLRPLKNIWDLKPFRSRELWFQKRSLLPLSVFVLMLINCMISPWWNLSVLY